jgi:hypothetical protein
VERGLRALPRHKAAGYLSGPEPSGTVRRSGKQTVKARPT